MRARIRSVVFASLLVAAAAAAMPPLQRLMARAADAEAGVIATSFAVLALVAAMVVVVQWLARRVADFGVRELIGLRADARRAAVAISRGRRGDRFLEARAEPVEIAQVRSEVWTLHQALHARLLADRTVLGSAVHDVKAGLAGLAHLLDAEARRTQEAGGTPSRGVVVACEEARRLLTVLTTMTAFLRTGQVAPEAEHEVDLVDVARSAVGQAATERPEVTVELHAANPARVRGDRTLLAQALANLVLNAVRAARTRVTVSVFAGVVRVEDDGPGLPGDLTALAAPFASEPLLEPDRVVAAGSLGLGLYIAHRVLEGHDGGLGLERSDDDGTVLLAYVGRVLG